MLAMENSIHQHSCDVIVYIIALISDKGKKFCWLTSQMTVFFPQGFLDLNNWYTMIHTHICTHIHKYVHVCLCIYAHIHTWGPCGILIIIKYTYIYRYIHMHMYICIYIYTCIFILIYIGLSDGGRVNMKQDMPEPLPHYISFLLPPFS